MHCTILTCIIQTCIAILSLSILNLYNIAECTMSFFCTTNALVHFVSATCHIDLPCYHALDSVLLYHYTDIIIPSKCLSALCASNMSHLSTLVLPQLQIACHHFSQFVQYCAYYTVMVKWTMFCIVANTLHCSTMCQLHVFPQLQIARHHFSLSSKTKCVPNHHQSNCAVASKCT